MTDHLRRCVKLATEHLASLEEELAHCRHHAASGDAEASAECGKLLDLIESAKLAINEMSLI